MLERFNLKQYQVVSLRGGDLYYTNHLTKFQAVQERLNTLEIFKLNDADVWIEREL